MKLEEWELRRLMRENKQNYEEAEFKKKKKKQKQKKKNRGRLKDEERKMTPCVGLPHIKLTMCHILLL